MQKGTGKGAKQNDKFVEKTLNTPLNMAKQQRKGSTDSKTSRGTRETSQGGADNRETA